MSAAPLLLGHRGTPRRHRENTLIGFQAALDAGLDGVELDVRRLLDGTLVVHHDLELLDGRPLNTLTRSQLEPHPVPLLADVLAWASQTGAYLNVELKFEGAQVDDRVARTCQAIRQHGLQRRVILSSFQPLQLRAARQLMPELERGLLYHRRYPLDLVPRVGRWLDVAALHPHHSLIDGPLMDVARRHGWRVNAWTVNDVPEVSRLSRLGVAGLIGDVPDVLLSARTR
ncbi:glycerophosphodiester phosphodiesterase [Deinococcus sonorensis]|uniref:Glycerophosphodiester phosphodiesterase n=2 Tax=Deinococcus sonorensis TaxID=309891 RepID=A0AAU7U8G5_9DEIO